MFLIFESNEDHNDYGNVLSEPIFSVLYSEFKPSAMRLEGNYKGSIVNILIDNRNTFKFVQTVVAQKLEFQWHELLLLKVLLTMVTLFGASLLVLMCE